MSLVMESHIQHPFPETNIVIICWCDVTGFEMNLQQTREWQILFMPQLTHYLDRWKWSAAIREENCKCGIEPSIINMTQPASLP